MRSESKKNKEQTQQAYVFLIGGVLSATGAGIIWGFGGVLLAVGLALIILVAFCAIEGSICDTHPSPPAD